MKSFVNCTSRRSGKSSPAVGVASTTLWCRTQSQTTVVRRWLCRVVKAVKLYVQVAQDMNNCIVCSCFVVHLCVHSYQYICD